jgi:hypothetical protein
MHDPRIPFKNPLIAAGLAFLIPGAGHWYQGRRFKATIYFAGILTLFVWGMVLGNWQPVYSQLVYPSRPDRDTAQNEFFRPQYKFSYGYAAQVLVGLPALPAALQEWRFRREDGDTPALAGPIDSDFEGILRPHGAAQEEARLVRGRIRITPTADGGSFDGVLTVLDDDGTTTDYSLGDDLELGRAVFGSPRRELQCSLAAADGDMFSRGEVRGTIARSFVNWYQAPRDTLELDRLHGRLNRRFDMALVFTWVAGLLNLLAIWDAADGPAYAYGDEKPDDDKTKS